MLIGLRGSIKKAEIQRTTLIWRTCSGPVLRRQQEGNNGETPCTSIQIYSRSLGCKSENTWPGERRRYLIIISYTIARKLAGRRRMAAFYKTERNLWLLSTISAGRTEVARGESRVFSQLVHPQIFYVHTHTHTHTHTHIYNFLFVFLHELICAGLVPASARA